MPKRASTILTLARSGGVAGIRPLPVVLDAGKLPRAVQKEIGSLVEKSRFFSLPAELPETGPAADRFQHSLTVEHEDGRTHTVTFTEGSAPEELRELKRLIKDHSRVL